MNCSMNRSNAWCARRSAANLAALLTKWQRTQMPLTALVALSASLGNATIARAQVVQLPSQHVFGSSGSVVVPDGGTADLGGIGRSSQGSMQSGFGPLSNRASGGAVGGSSMSVSVRIIDLEALDEAILAGASPRVSAATPTSAASTASTASTTSTAGTTPTAPGAGSSYPFIDEPTRWRGSRSVATCAIGRQYVSRSCQSVIVGK